MTTANTGAQPGQYPTDDPAGAHTAPNDEQPDQQTAVERDAPPTSVDLLRPTAVARRVHDAYVDWGDKFFEAPSKDDPKIKQALGGLLHSLWHNNRVLTYPFVAGVVLRWLGTTEMQGFAWYWMVVDTAAAYGITWVTTRKLPLPGESLAARSAVLAAGSYLTMCLAGCPNPITDTLLAIGVCLAQYVLVRCRRKRRRALVTEPEPPTITVEVVAEEPIEPLPPADPLLAEWQEIWAGVSATVSGAKHSTVESAAELRPGFIRLVIALRPGQDDPDSFMRTAALIAGYLHMKKSAVTVQEHPDDDSKAVVEIRQTAPLKDVIEWDDTLAPDDIHEALVLGRTEAGDWYRRLMVYAHMLILGMTRWGKSNELSVLLAGITKCKNAIPLMIDMKGGAEAAAWAPNLYWCATTSEEAKAMLRWLEHMIVTRVQMYGKRQLEFTRECPAFFLVIDEIAELTGMKTFDPEVVQLLESVAARGAGVGIHLIIVTQYGSLEYLNSPGMRANMAGGLCFKTQAPSDAQFLWGDWTRLDTSKINIKGVFVVKDDETGNLMKVKGQDFSSDSFVRALSLARAEWRNDPDRGPVVEPALVAAGGESLETRWDRAPNMIAAARRGEFIDDDPGAAADMQKRVEELIAKFQADDAARDAAAAAQAEPNGAAWADYTTPSTLFGEDMTATPAERVAAILEHATSGPAVAATVTDLNEVRQRWAERGYTLDDVADSGRSRSGAAVCAYLEAAGPHGRKVRDIMAACGIGRTTLHTRLTRLMRDGVLIRPVNNKREGWYTVAPGADLRAAWERVEQELSAERRAARMRPTEEAVEAPTGGDDAGVWPLPVRPTGGPTTDPTDHPTGGVNMPTSTPTGGPTGGDSDVVTGGVVDESEAWGA